MVRSGQQVLDWTEAARDFRESSEWEATPAGQQIGRLRPLASIHGVVMDPLISFGEPTVRGRGVRTEIVAELFRAGETPDGIAAMYELTTPQVNAALRYDLMRRRGA